MIQGKILYNTENLKKIPTTTGIYFFLNAQKIPVYIGKAVNISSRIQNHIQDVKNLKEIKIREATTYVDWRETNSEFEALLLESKMIKKYRPMYNISLKDDKTNVYIVIPKQKLPRIQFMRENDLKKESLYWFGPLTSMRSARMLMRRIRASIPFCTDKRKHACFYSHLGLCQPCPGYIETCGDIDEQKKLSREYMRNIRRLITLLDGNGKRVIKLLEADMCTLSKKQKYEEASVLRNRLEMLNSLFRKRLFFDEQLEDPLFLHKKRMEDSEDLRSKLALKRLDRVECFDVSIFSSKQAVSSMVVFKYGAPTKQEYRRFRIRGRSVYDPQMLEETLRRRFAHAEWPLPDLLIIDGGRVQLRYIYESLEKQLDSIPEIIGIAKRPDRIFHAKTLEQILISSDSPAMHYIQRARDEAHRFARTYHVALRDKLFLPTKRKK